MKICATVAVVATLAVVGWGVGRKINSSRNQGLLEQNRKTLEDSIDHELPKGTKYRQVAQFLESHAIDHSGLEKSVSNGNTVNVIEAQTREKIEGARYSCTIHLVFSFDDELLLTDYSDKFSCYGP